MPERSPSGTTDLSDGFLTRRKSSVHYFQDDSNKQLLFLSSSSCPQPIVEEE
jgi:hypothetical protein